MGNPFQKRAPAPHLHATEDCISCIAVALERIADAVEALAENPGGGGNAATLGRIENKLDALATATAKESKLMATFTEDVLARIAAQTTRLSSIDTALEALVANGTITDQNKADIMAAFGTTDDQLARAETALGTGVPPLPPPAV